jgi:dihydroneopterin aldolase
MDKIHINGLRLPCHIGINDDEREISQELVATLTMFFDIGPSAVSDNLNHTIDYRVVAARLRRHVSSREFQLLETLAESCAAIVLTEFPVDRVILRVDKPCALKVARPAVEIERCRLPT